MYTMTFALRDVILYVTSASVCIASLIFCILLKISHGVHVQLYMYTADIAVKYKTICVWMVLAFK